MKVYFACRKSKARKKDGLSPIELIVHLGGKRRTIVLNRYIKSTLFNSSKQQVKGDEQTNKYLSAILAKCYDIETEMIRTKMIYTVEMFVKAFQVGISRNNISVFNLFEEYIEQQAKKLERDLITKTVFSKYKCTIKYCKSALLYDKPLAELTTKDTETIYMYLLDRMSRNSSICYMIKLKTILFYAISEGYINKNPINYTLSKEKKTIEPLTLDEVRIIAHKNLDHSERLEHVRDLFIFQCYTALSFADMTNLTAKDIKTDENGKRWIIKERRKTKVRSTIPLVESSKNILEKYNYQLPTLSNQKYNAYLKEIQDICGIDKKLHSHLARHTCASLLLNNGVDLLTVSKILGHSSSKITESVYVTVFPSTIMQKVEQIADKIQVDNPAGGDSADRRD